jgi:hypothetical protein
LTIPIITTLSALNRRPVDLTIPIKAILFYLAKLDSPKWWNW